MAAVAIEPAKLKRFCRAHHVRRLALFGSALRDDFGPDSDVDVLVEFEAGHLIHGYDAVDFDIPWRIVEDDLSGRVTALEEMEKRSADRRGWTPLRDRWAFVVMGIAREDRRGLRLLSPGLS